MKYANSMSCIVLQMDTLAPTEFRTEEVVIGSTTMVSLHGELDIQHEPQVAASFARVLDRHPAALAADLRGLTFMDSTGAHALLNAETRCLTEDTPFFVIRGCVAVDRVLTVLGLDRLFKILAGPEHLPGGGGAAAGALL